MKLKVGDYIEAVRNGYMSDKYNNQQFSTKGKIYKITHVYDENFEILDDEDDPHEFPKKWLNKKDKNYYFKKIDERILKLRRIIK